MIEILMPLASAFYLFVDGGLIGITVHLLIVISTQKTPLCVFCVEMIKSPQTLILKQSGGWVMINSSFSREKLELIGM